MDHGRVRLGFEGERRKDKGERKKLKAESSKVEGKDSPRIAETAEKGLKKILATPMPKSF
jgi:hypothetical protein